jgi:hypothetical protein
MPKQDDVGGTTIFESHDRDSTVRISTTAVAKLTVMVADGSSVLTPPKALWGFLTIEQATEMHAKLGEWLQ